MSPTAKTTRKTPTAAYRFTVPLDASGIEDFKPDQDVKVLLVRADGKVLGSQIVKLDTRGTGQATFSFPGRPKAFRGIVGPANASDEELQGLQTISFSVSEKQWERTKELKWKLVPIPPYYWFWWHKWCRNFVIRGRVLCPDGSPVPNAKVCAYDVDGWLWWMSKELVGCATTGVDGTFEIKFRWCCGWWPWWWWWHHYHLWAFSPFLAEHIIPELHRLPDLKPIPLPDPVPDLRVIKQLLGEEEFAALNVVPKVATSLRTAARVKATEDVAAKYRLRVDDPVILDKMRDTLLDRFPQLLELKYLKIWPWWPWHPWWDCTPDIIFQVTQDCEEPDTIIVDEDFGDVRWNIPTLLDNVTLTANDQACCLAVPDGEPEGICALITNACWAGIDQIGGNPGALATPVGYYRPWPGAPATCDNGNDRPFGGNVKVQGHVGSDVDYYSFEWSDDNGANWYDMPPSAMGDIPRRYIDTSVTPWDFVTVPFRHNIGGRWVFESRQHYEAAHPEFSLGDWWWMANNYLSLLNWRTQSPFINGLYHLRIRGWKLVGGNLQNLGILNNCNTTGEARLALQIDNRLIGAGSGHPPSTPDHPCGAGTVHLCTMEPDTDIIAVRIIRDGSTVLNVDACGSVTIQDDDELEVDFFAYDPEGHLAYYTLKATYGENLTTGDIPRKPGATLTPLPGGAPGVPAAVHVGPDYADACSASPIWQGGAMTLKIKAKEVFKKTCCYQLELRAHKRTIVSCDYSFWNHTNLSEYSFMITVPPLPILELPETAIRIKKTDS